MAFHNSSLSKKKISFKVKLNPFSFLTIPFLILLIFLVILPFFFVIFYSLSNIEDSTLIMTFDNFVKFLTDPSFWDKLWLSIYFAFMATLMCLIFGYPVAYFIARTRPKIRTIFVILITLPMWVNMLLRVIGLKSIMELVTSWFQNINPNFHIIGTDFAVIFGEVFVSIPFMIIPIYTQLLKLDPTLLEASKDLGNNSFKTFFKVTLPISMPGVISGITMVFLPAATSIVIPKYMGGGLPRYTLIGNLIENYFVKQSNYNQGAAMALIMTVVILAIIFVVKLFDRSEVKIQKTKKQSAKAQKGVVTNEK